MQNARDTASKLILARLHFEHAPALRHVATSSELPRL